jgi:hypothetical protein
LNLKGKSIRGIQSILFSATGSEIYCGIETNTVLIVDVQSGQVVDRIAGARRVYSSQFSAHELVVKKDQYLLREPREIKMPAM